MGIYVVRRSLLLLVTLLIVTVVVFLLLRVAPGNAVDALLEEVIVFESDLEAYRADLGLDKPLYEQYFVWLGDLVQGDLGRSFQTNLPVSTLIKDRLPNSVRLGLMAVGISLVIAIPIGVLSAVKRGSWSDYISRIFAILALSVPSFWIATMVIVFPANWWGWTPPLQFLPFRIDAKENFVIFLIPAILLGTHLTGTIMRMTRSMMLEVLGSDYIRTAHAKGLSGFTVISRHALRNALIPIVTVIGSLVGTLVGGSVIMETIFGIPGVGALMRDSVIQKDYPVVQSVTVFLAAFVLVMNFFVDLAYTWMDPRIRYN